jgi:hypothetical protein
VTRGERELPADERDTLAHARKAVPAGRGVDVEAVTVGGDDRDAAVDDGGREPELVERRGPQLGDDRP